MLAVTVKRVYHAVDDRLVIQCLPGQSFLQADNIKRNGDFELKLYIIRKQLSNIVLEMKEGGVLEDVDVGA